MMGAGFDEYRRGSQRRSRLQRGSLLVVLAIFCALLLTYGLPAVAYRVSLAIQRGASDARDEGLQKELAELSDTSEAFRRVAERVKPAVVHIQSVRILRDTPTSPITHGDREGTPRYFFQSGQGSGVVVDTTGYILTNYHVVADSGEVQVKVPQHSGFLRATVVGTDPGTDLALLKIDSAGLTLTAATFGDSEQLAVGDWVLAIGNPFGLDQSVTAGIVSAKGRADLLENVDVQDFIQTDAAISPGSSGGPLVNLRGEVVGINTATVGGGSAGISFAIPSKLAQAGSEQLQQFGRIRRGWLGIFLHLADRSERNDSAIIVDYIVPGSPADKASLQVGDAIILYDKQPFADARTLQRMITRTPPEKEVPLTVIRGKRQLVIPVTIDLQPDAPVVLPGEREWGIQLSLLTNHLASQLGTSNKGVLVVSVHPRMRAAGKLRPGDVITGVDGSAVGSLEAYGKALQGVDLQRIAVTLTVRNGRQVREVLLDPVSPSG